ncbi:MAG: hypothetical protein LBQ09_02285, partial [Acidobacteriaceae bacterium]|nr:hypothetical protein [Acidobacteriaceae bacterium]
MMRRPAWRAFVLYISMTLVLLWPLLPAFARAFPQDTGDPVLNTWLLAWSARHMPLTTSWWNAGMFYPMPNAMALSELLIGLLPMTLPVQWLTGNATLAYNVAFALSFPLCAMAAYALALELTGRAEYAFVAGLAYAFAPYRAMQLGHVQVLSYYWAPLALLGLHRYLNTGRRSSLALFAVAWLLQVLTNGYALFHLSLLLALWVVWFVRSRRMCIDIAAAWALAALPLLPILWTYWRVHHALHLTRDINSTKMFSLELTDSLHVSTELLLLGGRLGIPRAEAGAFPGITLLVVALVSGLVYWRVRKKPAPSAFTLDQRVVMVVSVVAALVALSAVILGPWRVGPLTVTEFRKPFSIAVYAAAYVALRGATVRRGYAARSVWMFYALAMVAMYVLALGPEPRLFGQPVLYKSPYTWLMGLPGVNEFRVPARFVMLAVLCQSMLLAAAMEFL